MKRLTFSLLPLFLVFGCGGGGGDTCERGTDVTCSKLVECGVVPSDAECRAGFNMNCDVNNGCDEGEVYNEGRASDCIVEIANASCEDITNGTNLDSCELVCM